MCRLNGFFLKSIKQIFNKRKPGDLKIN